MLCVKLSLVIHCFPTARGSSASDCSSRASAPGILHGDVDTNNVLMGDADAPVGNRGFTITDLDVTILSKQEGSLAGPDLKMMSCAHATFFHSDFDT
jgi:hypothetical protein